MYCISVLCVHINLHNLTCLVIILELFLSLQGEKIVQHMQYVMCHVQTKWSLTTVTLYACQGGRQGLMGNWAAVPESLLSRFLG